MTATVHFKTKTQTKTKWLKDPTCAIFLKIIWLKDIKYDDVGWINDASLKVNLANLIPTALLELYDVQCTRRRGGFCRALLDFGAPEPWRAGKVFHHPHTPPRWGPHPSNNTKLTQWCDQKVLTFYSWSTNIQFIKILWTIGTAAWIWPASLCDIWTDGQKTLNTFGAR